MTLALITCLSGSLRADEAKTKHVGQWGSKGEEKGQFNSPIGIAISKEDVVYVTDLNNARLQKFSTDGNLTRSRLKR